MWRAVIRDKQGHIHPAAYTVRAVYSAWEALRFGDPRAQLLQGSAWDAAKPHVLRTLSWSTEPAEALAPLEHALDTAYRQTAGHWAANPPIRSSPASSDRGSCSRLGIVSQNRPPYVPYANR